MDKLLNHLKKGNMNQEQKTIFKEDLLSRAYDSDSITQDINDGIQQSNLYSLLNRDETIFNAIKEFNPMEVVL